MNNQYQFLPDRSPRLYANILPVGFTSLGVLRIRTGTEGVCVRNRLTGIYSLLNAGCIKPLDQRKVVKLLNSGEN